MISSVPEGKTLVLYDGMCVLCSRLISFLLKVDKRKVLYFGTLQACPIESFAQQLPQNDFDSVVVIKGDQIYSFSEAIIQIGIALGGIYKIAIVSRLLPLKWRDSMYRWVAKNRFRWFGKRSDCHLPSERDKERFISWIDNQR